MADISSQDNIRYCIDTLSTRITGLLTTNSNTAVNLTRAQNVTKISVLGSQPSGTFRYFAFNVGGKWGYLDKSGNFTAFAANAATFDNLAQYGNTASQLGALINIPGLAGKSFGFAVALAADDPANALPTASLSFTGSSNNQVLTTTEYSPTYSLGQDSQIASYSLDTSTANGGSVSVTAQIKDENGELSSWADPASLKGSKAQTIQFKAVYSASTVNVSSAAINEASVIYAHALKTVSGVNDGEVITNTVDWYMPIHNCRLTINHAPLSDADIRAYVAFRTQPQQVRGETLGIGSGGRKTFQLAHTGGIKYDTFRLFYDNQEVFMNFELNCEAARVTCEAPSGVIVSCDYDFGWDKELWRELTLSQRWGMDGYDRSEFRLYVADNEKTAAAVKIQLVSKSGHITNEVLGTASGTAKSFRLRHQVKDGKISVTANNAVVASRYWTLLDDPQYISVAAGSGQTVRASYDWVSESPKIYQFSAVFSG